MPLCYGAFAGPRKDAHTLSTQIRQNCDTLFTMPGMGSSSLWVERPSPNGYNLSTWMTAFTPEEQQEMVEILRRTKRPCVVYNPRLLLLWMPGGTRSTHLFSLSPVRLQRNSHHFRGL